MRVIKGAIESSDDWQSCLKRSQSLLKRTAMYEQEYRLGLIVSSAIYLKLLRIWQTNKNRG